MGKCIYYILLIILKNNNKSRNAVCSYVCKYMNRYKNFSTYSIIMIDFHISLWIFQNFSSFYTRYVLSV